VAFAEYLESHARRVYGSASESELVSDGRAPSLWLIRLGNGCEIIEVGQEIEAGADVLSLCQVCPTAALYVPSAEATLQVAVANVLQNSSRSALFGLIRDGRLSPPVGLHKGWTCLIQGRE
jgi:hypothetical protein